MKVLFLNPARTGQGNIPLNIPQLIACIRKAGHRVQLFDFADYEVFDPSLKEYESHFFKEAQPDEVESAYALKKTDYRIDFDNLIRDYKPDLIAVSSLTVDLNFAMEFLKPFKAIYELPILVGGVHAILLPLEVLNNSVVDFVCVGEGEIAVPELLNRLDRHEALIGLKGIWFKRYGFVSQNEREKLTDIRTNPPPDFSDFYPLQFYRPFDGKRYKMINYEFSRGCPYSCSYCVNSTFKVLYKGLGPYHRNKSVDQSITELKELIKKYGFTFIRFWDEDFTAVNVNILKEYAERYKAEIGLPFINFARVTSLTEEKVKVLKDMGSRTFAMAIESGDYWIRKNVLNRDMTNEQIVNGFRLVQKYGIRTSAYNMIGLPHETRETIFETIELNRTVNPGSFSVSILEPYKGTPIRKICEEQGLDPNYEPHWNQAQFIPKGMTGEEILGLHRTFPLYVKFPKERWEEIKLAETSEPTFKVLLKQFHELIE